MRLLPAFAASSLLLALVVPSAASAAPEKRRDRTPLENFDWNVAKGGLYEPGALMLISRTVDDRPALERAGRTLGCEIGRQLGRRALFVVRCTGKQTTRELVAAWEKVPDVRWVDASWYDELEAAPNDLDPRQWYHQNTGQTVDGVVGVPGADLGSIAAWDAATGTKERVIAIVDVGIYPRHQDLADQIWTNAGEICGNGVDDDHNGYVDDCHGWDFGEDDPDADPSTLPDMQSDGDPCLNWHATMIAGLAAAHGNDGRGIAGLNWDVSLMNLKRHHDSSCVAASNSGTEGAAYAMDNGADVISFSFSSSSYSASFEQVLQEASGKGIIVVSSGGNGGADDDQQERYPNQFNVVHKLVTVTTDNRDQLWDGSNWGARTVDLAVPGTAVISTNLGSPTAYGAGSGASFTAGIAAGAATLVWSAFPSLGASEVLQALKEGGRHLDALDCAQTAKCVSTGRRLDVWGAMNRANELAPPHPVLAEPTWTEQGNGDGALEPGETFTLAPVVSNQGTGPLHGLIATLSFDGAPSELGLVTASTNLGRIDPGTSNDPSALASPLAVTLGTGCTGDSTQHATVTLTDIFGQVWAGGPYDLAIRCGDAPASPDAGTTTMPGADAGSGGEGGGSGGAGSDGCRCLATRDAASSSLFVALAALAWVAALRRRHG